MFFQDKEHKFPKIESKVSRDKLQFQTLLEKYFAKETALLEFL